MAAIIKSGTNVNGTVSFGANTCCLHIKGNGGAAVVTVNGKTFAVTTTSLYDVFDVDSTGFVVVSGAVDYVALG
jgi:hypothetical protein